MAICDGKIAFFSVGAALERIGELKAKGIDHDWKGVFEVYSCPNCPAFHIGHGAPWALDDDHRDALECNLGLIGATLREMKIPPRLWSDCFQEGVVGLAAAISRCDAEKSDIATFGRKCIRNRVNDHLRETAVIRVCRGRVAAAMSDRKKAGPRYRLALLYRDYRSRPVASLDDPASDLGPPPDGGPSAEALAAGRNEVDVILDFIAARDARAANVLRRDMAGYSRGEIAAELGLTRGHVNTLAARAYAAVREDRKRREDEGKKEGLRRLMAKYA